MKVIDREELKEKLDRGDEFQLVMTLDKEAFDRAHIPGSLHFHNVREAIERLNPEQETIVYCAGRACRSSIDAYLTLRGSGFEHLYRYAGGLEEWQEASYPLEGSLLEVDAARVCW